jgi:hypothetical protein
MLETSANDNRRVLCGAWNIGCTLFGQGEFNYA